MGKLKTLLKVASSQPTDPMSRQILDDEIFFGNQLSNDGGLLHLGRATDLGNVFRDRD